MVRCNLSILLAERGLSISRVSKDTGISRTTLTALSTNSSQGIQFDTLNTLCMHLQISPDQLISFFPANIIIESLKDENDTFEVTLLITEYGRTKIFHISCTLNFHYKNETLNTISSTLTMGTQNSSDEKDYLSKFFYTLPVYHVKDFEHNLNIKLLDILLYYPISGICYGIPIEFFWDKSLRES